jgi:predicted RNA binding protein YcfA (HicA-like mRNA interferase family)
MKSEKVFLKIIRGDLKNIKFREIQALVDDFGFKLVRVSGSHHIYTNEEISAIINLQNSNGEAKPYQIRQIVKLIEKYNLKP